MSISPNNGLYEVPSADRLSGSRMRVLQVISHLNPKLGGISAVVPRLTLEMNRRHAVNAELCLFSAPEELNQTTAAKGLSFSLWPSSRVQWLRDGMLRLKFQTLAKSMNVIHIHGLWENSTTVAARVAKATHTPFVVSAHGMLEPWALANKALKKKIYATLLERTNIQSATCLHALTDAEAEDYRRFGCKQPIAVIANGVDSPGSADKHLFLQRYPSLVNKTILLFLGRIHYKKGLDVLIPAWASIAERYPEATLVFAGPDSENSESVARQSLNDFGMADRAVFTGMLQEEMKWSALAAATCFVLPSYSEGLSVAVLEALSMGVPVIVSEQCHFPEVATADAGWVIKTEVPSLQQALTEVLDNSEAKNSEIGARGMRLAQVYRWEAVSTQMAKLYEWLNAVESPNAASARGLFV